MCRRWSESLASRQSTWNRMDVLRTICDTVTPQPGHDGTSWAAALDASVNTVLESCIDLDPVGDGTARRRSDGRSVWIEPITNQATSEHILTQEEHILTWALDAQSDNPTPSATITDVALDDGQYASASAVAGDDRLVLVVGPAGAGKTRMLQAAVSDLHGQQRPVMGLTPTAKAARVLQTETGMVADTVAKLLYELDRPDSDDSWWDAGPGMTVIVDEAGMLNTSDLSRLVTHAEQRQWRLALVGDPHQLQAVGRGGMFLELCDTGRRVELEHLHRFTNRWEAAASLELRRGNPSALDTYAAHGRIRAGTFAEHLDTIGDLWQQCRSEGESLSIITTRTEHVNAINDHIQQRRLDTGELDQATLAQVDDAWVMVGDVVATRRNERRLRTSVGEPVRNRERWTVTATDTVEEGDVTVTRLDGHGTITLPRDYVRQHMQLAYATTEPGAQGDTSERSLTLATNATTRRGLYMAMTRGQRENLALVVTNTHDLAEARAVLEAVLFSDRADIPATVQRRNLAATVPASVPQRRVRIPDWFDQIRDEAEEGWRIAQQRLDERNTERVAARERVALARQELPTAQEAHAPFAEQVATAERIVNQAQSELRKAQDELRRAGRVHRRSARRDVDAAGDVLAVATDRLNRAEELAAPTRRRVNELHNVIDDHRRMDSTRRMFDQFNDLEGVARDAGRLCHALDQWKHWANGHNLDNAALVEIAATFADHDDRPGISQLAAPLTQWAQRQGLELQPPTRSTPTRSSIGNRNRLLRGRQLGLRKPVIMRWADRARRSHTSPAVRRGERSCLPTFPGGSAKRARAVSGRVSAPLRSVPIRFPSIGRTVSSSADIRASSAGSLAPTTSACVVFELVDLVLGHLCTLLHLVSLGACLVVDDIGSLVDALLHLVLVPRDRLLDLVDESHDVLPRCRRSTVPALVTGPDTSLSLAVNTGAPVSSGSHVDACSSESIGNTGAKRVLAGGGVAAEAGPVRGGVAEQGFG